MLFYCKVKKILNVKFKTGGTSSSAGAAASTTPTNGKHKLFLTDGWSCCFTGVCIYMFRINTSKQLPEEGFHKDL